MLTSHGPISEQQQLLNQRRPSNRNNSHSYVLFAEILFAWLVINKRHNLVVCMGVCGSWTRDMCTNVLSYVIFGYMYWYTKYDVCLKLKCVCVWIYLNIDLYIYIYRDICMCVCTRCNMSIFPDVGFLFTEPSQPCESTSIFSPPSSPWFAARSAANAEREKLTPLPVPKKVFPPLEPVNRWK